MGEIHLSQTNHGGGAGKKDPPKSRKTTLRSGAMMLAMSIVGETAPMARPRPEGKKSALVQGRSRLNAPTEFVSWRKLMPRNTKNAEALSFSPILIDTISARHSLVRAIHPHEVDHDVEDRPRDDGVRHFEHNLGEEEARGAIQAGRALSDQNLALHRKGHDEREEYREGGVDGELSGRPRSAGAPGAPAETHEKEHTNLGQDVGLAVAELEERKADQDEQDDRLPDRADEDRLVADLRASDQRAQLVTIKPPTISSHARETRM